MRNIKVSNTTRTTEQKWNVDKERFVLYADIMGFKNKVATVDYKILKPQMQKFREEMVNGISPYLQLNQLQFVMFSDSVYIVTRDSGSGMFNIITKAAACLMQVAMSNKFPIKGVIAWGLAYYDKVNELYFGQPFVDAYELHEQLKYYGIVVHHSAEKALKSSIVEAGAYNNSKINLKSGLCSHYHLCWAFVRTNLNQTDLTNSCNEWLDEISENVSGEPRMYIDNTRDILEDDKDFNDRIPIEIKKGKVI